MTRELYMGRQLAGQGGTGVGGVATLLKPGKRRSCGLIVAPTTAAQVGGTSCGGAVSCPWPTGLPCITALLAWRGCYLHITLLAGFLRGRAPLPVFLSLRGGCGRVGPVCQSSAAAIVTDKTEADAACAYSLGVSGVGDSSDCSA